MKTTKAIGQTRNPKFILCLALVLSGVLPGFSAVRDRAENGSGSSTNDWQTKAIASKADLDRVIGQLQIPSARFDAMVALLDFAGWPKGNIRNHDLKVNTLHDKAIKAMQTCNGLDAVVGPAPAARVLGEHKDVGIQMLIFSPFPFDRVLRSG